MPTIEEGTLSALGHIVAAAKANPELDRELVAMAIGLVHEAAYEQHPTDDGAAARQIARAVPKALERLREPGAPERLRAAVAEREAAAARAEAQERAAGAAAAPDPYAAAGLARSNSREQQAQLDKNNRRLADEAARIRDKGAAGKSAEAGARFKAETEARMAAGEDPGFACFRSINPQAPVQRVPPTWQEVKAAQKGGLRREISPVARLRVEAARRGATDV